MEDLVVQTVQAGSDCALHCSGNMNEMVGIAAVSLPMSDISLNRWKKAEAMRKAPPPFSDKTALLDRLDMLLGVAATST
jgi:hypothetical protein